MAKNHSIGGTARIIITMIIALNVNGPKMVLCIYSPFGFSGDVTRVTRGWSAGLISAA